MVTVSANPGGNVSTGRKISSMLIVRRDGARVIGVSCSSYIAPRLVTTWELAGQTMETNNGEFMSEDKA